MKPIPFEKWHGLGNDFILIEGEEALPVELVKQLCDRRTGIGADGVLVVGADPQMIVQNADGSRPEMCGNGIRCVAGYLARRKYLAEGGPKATGPNPSTELEWLIATDDGPKRCRTTHLGRDHFQVAVDMGKAELNGTRQFTAKGASATFYLVATGNPHAITFVTGDATGLLDALGPALEANTEGGINVEVCTPEASCLRVEVWERGVGRTRACGTGACATVVAACSLGLREFGQPHVVELPGGPLQVTVNRTDLQLRMLGPAQFVFQGVWG